VKHVHQTIVYILPLLFSLAAEATESKDLARLLKESHCVETRSKSGVASYKCDGTLSTELHSQRSQQARGIASEEEATETQSKSIVENRHSASTMVASNQSTHHKSVDEKIKSCLASIYASQVNYYRSSGKYTSRTENLGVDRNQTCNGLYIYTNVANEKEFKITAQFGRNIWTVDQTKTLTKKR
jgi:hypothetical protein